MLRTASSLSPQGLLTLGSDPARFQAKPPACYRASWQLPGPDSHRQATTSLRTRRTPCTTSRCHLPFCWAHEKGSLGVKQLSGGHGPVSPDTPAASRGESGHGQKPRSHGTSVLRLKPAFEVPCVRRGVGSPARDARSGCFIRVVRAGGCPGLRVYTGQCRVSVAVMFACYLVRASRGRDRLVRLSVASARSPVRTPVLAGCLPRPRARRGCLRLSRSTLRTKWLPSCQVRSVLRQPVRA
jgi:hypothetical protein